MKKKYDSPQLEIEKFNVLSNVFTITYSLQYESEYEDAFKVIDGNNVKWE